MGAYDNPKIIRDRSGEIYGQALAGFGKSIAGGLTNAANKRDQLRQQASAEQKRTQNIQYQIQQQQFSERNRNFTELRKSGVPLTGQFKGLTQDSLMGVGKPGDENYQMGSVEAATLLATSSDLTLELRQSLQKTIDDSTQFQQGLLQNAGKIVAELEQYKDLPASELMKNFTFSGATDYERLGSQFTAAILSEKELPGAFTNKTLTRGADGAQILSTSTKLKPDNSLIKGYPEFQDEEKYPRDSDGNIEIKWSKDINKDVNLLDDIEKGIESSNISEELNFTKDGTLTEEQFVGGVTGSDNPIKGLPNYRQVMLEKIVNVGNWVNVPDPQNPGKFIPGGALRDQLKGVAAGKLTLPDQQLSAYMQNRLGLSGSFDMKKFRTGEDDGKEDSIMDTWAQNKYGKKWDGGMQEAFIEDELVEEFLTDRTSKLKRRPANKQDIANGWSVKDPKTGEQTVYFQGKEQVSQVASKEKKGYDSKPLVNKFVKQVTENPGSMAREILSYDLVKENVTSEGFDPGGDRVIKPGEKVITLGKKGDDNYSEFNLTNKEDQRRYARKIIKGDERISTLPTKDRQMVIDGIIDSFPNATKEPEIDAATGLEKVSTDNVALYEEQSTKLNAVIDASERLSNADGVFVGTKGMMKDGDSKLFVNALIDIIKEVPADPKNLISSLNLQFKGAGGDSDKEKSSGVRKGRMLNNAMAYILSSKNPYNLDKKIFDAYRAEMLESDK